MSHRLILLVLLALTAAPALALGQAPSIPVAKLEVYPADVQLGTKRDRQSFVVMATKPDGVTIEVTKQAQLTIANPALVKLDGHTLYAAADGATQMQVAFGGQTVTVPIAVKDAAADRAISFKLDVMPVFMRAGCNTGS